MARKEEKQHVSLSSSHPVFTEHKWGNPANAGKHYKRPYSKTRSSAAEYNRRNK